MNNITHVALEEQGTTEQPAGSNQTKYGKWFGLDGVSWCAMFVSWCYAQAGSPLHGLGYTHGFAGTQTALRIFKMRKEITPSPQPGDIVLFDFNGDGKVEHTGIFIHWIDSEFFCTVEGNTSLHNDVNGGSVMMRTRHVRGATFVHPEKSLAPQ